jgi:hypothetical protein
MQPHRELIPGRRSDDDFHIHPGVADRDDDRGRRASGAPRAHRGQFGAARLGERCAEAL